MTPRQLQALEDVGLAPPRPSITIKKKAHISQGTRVKVVNPLFFWADHYKVGDTGVVVKDWGTKGEERQRLLEVKLDVVRHPDKPVVAIALWELEAIG